MKQLLTYRSVYFLGIGGIGMSAIARFLHYHGIKVSGYDRTASALTRQLETEGMEIHFTDDPSLIPAGIDLVVYTPAIPADNSEYRYLADLKVPMKKRAEVLGMITSRGKTIATAGTHGKTTTTTLISHILHTCGVPFNSFLGGISKNYGTNFICPPGGSGEADPSSVRPEYYVAEADEFDRSFLQLKPFIGIITSMDPDHLDIYGSIDEMHNSFRSFTRQIERGGYLVLNQDIEYLIPSTEDIHKWTYALEGVSDYRAGGITVSDGHYRFDLYTPKGVIKNLELGLPGRFNLENAVAACAAADILGLPGNKISEALATFSGVERRFDFRIKRDDLVYIDDYAHHPDEISACIRAVREIYPGRRVTAIFQPHLYSRTRDFADAFARSLELADSVLLMDIYPAREQPIEGVTAAFLLEKIQKDDKKLVERKNLLEELISRELDVLLTLGAGDIDQMAGPIVEFFDKR